MSATRYKPKINFDVLIIGTGAIGLAKVIGLLGTKPKLKSIIEIIGVFNYHD